MIRHLLFKHPESYRALRPGDWIASFCAYKGSIAGPPLAWCPYFGDTGNWQANPDNAAEILRTLAGLLRPQYHALVLILKSEFYSGGLYFETPSDGDRILAFRSVEITPEAYRSLKQMAENVEHTLEIYARRGEEPPDPLEGLEDAGVFNLQGGFA